MKVIHVLADGTELEDITGYEVPEDNPIYEVLGYEDHD